MAPQDYFPEWVIQALLGAGVMIGGVWGGVRLFLTGQRANRPELQTAESDLRAIMARMHEEQIEAHEETQKTLADHGTKLAVIRALIDKR